VDVEGLGFSFICSGILGNGMVFGCLIFGSEGMGWYLVDGSFGYEGHGCLEGCWNNMFVEGLMRICRI